MSAIPSPTGLVDYALRRPGDVRAANVVAGGTSWGGYSLERDLANLVA